MNFETSMQQGERSAEKKPLALLSASEISDM